MGKPILDVDPFVICIVLLLLMVILVIAGNRMRRKFWSTEEDVAKGGVNSLVGALFGLWGFILAFTFSQSGSRFDNVSTTIVDEAAVLRTTILRADFFPDSIRAVYRSDLRKYVEQRISFYENVSDKEKFARNREELSNTARALWTRTVNLSKRTDLGTKISDMSSSLLSLFDIGIKCETKLNSGIPRPIIFLLIFLSLSICVVAGFATPNLKTKEWIIISVFGLMAATIIFITIDLARPLGGIIKPDTAQNAIMDLRKLF
jgi:hypothetical protein